MRRGFKQEAEVTAAELRVELGLRDIDALDPFAFADYLGVPVYPLHRLVAFGAHEPYVRSIKAAGTTFSALTVQDVFGASLIVYNERHSSRRLVNSVTHELFHVLEGHEAHTLIGTTGRLTWDAVAEEEADWLAASALVPRSGALYLLDHGLSADAAADALSVSVQLFQWRARATGVYRQLEATRRLRGRVAEV